MHLHLSLIHHLSWDISSPTPHLSSYHTHASINVLWRSSTQPHPSSPYPICLLSPDNQSYNAQQEETGAMVMWASGHYPVTGYTARQPSPSIRLLPHFKSLSLSLSTPADQALLSCPSSLSLSLSVPLALSAVAPSPICVTCLKVKTSSRSMCAALHHHLLPPILSASATATHNSSMQRAEQWARREGCCVCQAFL